MNRPGIELALASYRGLLDKELRAILNQTGQLYDWMRYHLGWQNQSGQSVQLSPGKQIRSCALFTAAKSVGMKETDIARCAPAAAAIELIHNFSLLHDDVEDKSINRRGRPTLWTFAGEAQAINTGDGMFSIARLAQHRLSELDFSADLVLSVIRELDMTCLQLVEGQQLDIAFEDRGDVTQDEYIRMAEGKTAAMFSAPFAIGAMLGGASSKDVAIFNLFGKSLGLAFQMVDDVLGIWGDTEVTGKPVGDDLRTLKMTFPIIYARDHESSAGREFRTAYKKLPATDMEVAHLTELLTATGAKEETEKEARRQIDIGNQRLASLSFVPSSESYIEEFSSLLIGRAF